MRLQEIRDGIVASVGVSRQRGKVALEHGRSRHGLNAAVLKCGKLLPLVAKEPEDLVLDEGTADGAAVLIALQNVARCALLLIEIGVCVESVVAQELEGASVDLVGAGFRDYSDDAVGFASALGG